MAGGVWERRGKHLKQVITFIKPQQYPKRYDFTRIATSTVQRQFNDRFKAAMDYALSTAR